MNPRTPNFTYTSVNLSFGLSITYANLKHCKYNNHNYHPQVVKVTLVPDQNTWDVVTVAYTVNEFLVLNGLVKAAAISDRVADNETITGTHVLFPHRCELRLQIDDILKAYI